ncbi:substrate-binding and vWA domain-containing protein [Planosporangium sp. 12N6]|uniref:substrate-binding and vWA domain-containing protein n=1 Tax=Planosporangium spinosum TaxID=3402278 RepID=UPI003CEC8BEA
MLVVLDTSPRRRNPLPLVIAVVIGLVAIIGIYLVLKPSGDGRSTAARGDCVALTVAASSEKSALLSDLAAGYNGSGRTFGGTCADVKVVSKASGAAMEALAAGWDAGRDGGPAPQVWSPASSSWVSLLRQRVASTDKGTLVDDTKPASIAQSPLVLAMPKPMAEALGWPGKRLGWSDVLGLTNDPNGWGAVGHPEWGSFRLGKTNPHFSTSGLHATVGSYVAATGRSGDLTEADLADPKVLDFVKGVEAGVVHYGDTTLTFLANLADEDARGRGMNYISAVAVEEKSVYDYNQGNPTGDPKLAGKGRKPRVPLVAVYPKEGTLVSDNPYVVLATASDEQKAAAADFLAYLQQSQQQKRFTEAAFRTFDGKPGPALSQANGVLPDQQVDVLDPPASAVLAKALGTWDIQRKRARVLLVLDVSGSMADDAAGGRSKLELAKQAVLRSMGLFAADDEVGLWTFSTEQRGATTPYTERVPIGPVSGNSGRITQVVNALSAEGGTALYASTRAAQQKLLASAAPDRINAVVVLTDGKNEYPKDSDLNGLLRDLDASNLENSVRVFTIAYGDKADLDTLRRISSASRAAAYDARNPTSIDTVLVNVISNF